MIPRRAAATPGDDGFAAVVVLALAGVLVLIAGLVISLGSLAITRHRAAAAADLSALAAALHADQGQAAACQVARHVAAAQAASVETCELSGATAFVRVAVHPSGFLAGLGLVRSTARAGPAGAL